MLTKGTNLRFWCQKVLPLVYDDSLSYYELLNKVVLHLNQNTENINQLIDFYNTFAEDVEDIIRQMMDEGDFNKIVADTLGSIIANEYDPEHPYIIFDYCIYNSKLYRANGSTTGEFDPEKWDERPVTYDLTTIQNYIYTLDAGNVAYDPTASYGSGTVGHKIKNLTANDVAFDSTETYDDDTVGKELKELKNNVSELDAGDIEYDSSETYDSGTVGKELSDLSGAVTETQNTVGYVLGAETAGQSVLSGSYVIYNNQLYKASQNIASTDAAPYTGKITSVDNIGEDVKFLNNWTLKKNFTFSVPGNGTKTINFDTAEYSFILCTKGTTLMSLVNVLLYVSGYAARADRGVAVNISGNTNVTLDMTVDQPRIAVHNSASEGVTLMLIPLTATTNYTIS